MIASIEVDKTRRYGGGCAFYSDLGRRSAGQDEMPGGNDASVRSSSKRTIYASKEAVLRGSVCFAIGSIRYVWTSR